MPEEREDYEVFVLALEYYIEGCVTETGYGVGWREVNLDYYKNLAVESGFEVVKEEVTDQIFKLVCKS